MDLVFLRRAHRLDGDLAPAAELSQPPLYQRVPALRDGRKERLRGVPHDGRQLAGAVAELGLDEEGPFLGRSQVLLGDQENAFDVLAGGGQLLDEKSGHGVLSIRSFCAAGLRTRRANCRKIS
ncbi:MAG: hypothetical protein NT049_18135 [Planctomycetota bacterium]|nr:hypothetical protein [Planctomycetota bacterium]